MTKEKEQVYFAKERDKKGRGRGGKARAECCVEVT